MCLLSGLLTYQALSVTLFNIAECIEPACPNGTWHCSVTNQCLDVNSPCDGRCYYGQWVYFCEDQNKCLPKMVPCAEGQCGGGYMFCGNHDPPCKSESDHCQVDDFCYERNGSVCMNSACFFEERKWYCPRSQSCISLEQSCFGECFEGRVYCGGGVCRRGECKSIDFVPEDLTTLHTCPNHRNWCGMADCFELYFSGDAACLKKCKFIIGCWVIASFDKNCSTTLRKNAKYLPDCLGPFQSQDDSSQANIVAITLVALLVGTVVIISTIYYAVRKGTTRKTAMPRNEPIVPMNKGAKDYQYYTEEAKEEENHYDNEYYFTENLGQGQYEYCNDT